MIEIRFDGVKQIRKFFSGKEKQLNEVAHNTATDLVKRAPKIIGDAIAEGYAVSSSDARKKHARIDTAWNPWGTGVWGARITFRGSRRASWPVYANGRQTVPKSRFKLKRFKGEKKKEPKQYEVSMEVYRGKRTPLRTSASGSKPFVQRRKIEKKGVIAYIYSTTNKRVFPHIGPSIPETITNPKVKAKWQDRLRALAEERLQHNAKRLLK